MSRTTYPGPMPWLEKAAESIPHQPGDLGRATDIEAFGVFSDLIGQACGQKDPAVAADQVAAAEARLAPLRIALAAAEQILAECRPEATAPAKPTAKPAPAPAAPKATA